MNPYWAQNEPLLIPNTPYTLVGYSVAAIRTGFYIPELNIQLDCGIESGFIPDHVFVTHGHSDHSYHIPMVPVELTNAKSTVTRIPTIYLPEKVKELCRDFIVATHAFSKNNPNHKRIHEKYILHGVKPNQCLDIMLKKKPYTIEIISCDHTVPTVGYGFIERRRRLKSEYIGLSGQELSQLKRDGIEITSEVMIPQFCYLGDTTGKVLKNPMLEKYSVVMIECTYLYPEHAGQAKSNKHIYWKDLESYILDHPEITFVLFHFSQRYSPGDVLEFFQDCKPTNVILWVPKNCDSIAMVTQG